MMLRQVWRDVQKWTLLEFILLGIICTFVLFCVFVMVHGPKKPLHPQHRNPHVRIYIDPEYGCEYIVHQDMLVPRMMDATTHAGCRRD